MRHASLTASDGVLVLRDLESGAGTFLAGADVEEAELVDGDVFELGAGDGSFMAQWAGAHPERNFLAVERLLGRLRKLDRKGQRLGLRNLCVMRIEASYFLELLLPPASVTLSDTATEPTTRTWSRSVSEPRTTTAPVNWNVPLSTSEPWPIRSPCPTPSCNSVPAAAMLMGR